MEEGFTPSVWRKEEEGGKIEEDEEEEEDFLEVDDIKKKLFDGLETPMKRESYLGTKKQPVVVFLRVRPKSQLEILNRDADCLHHLTENELLAVAPRTSQTYKNKNGARCVTEGNQRFMFTKIFNPDTSQKEVFDEGLLPTLKDFFEGQNCLVFTYGVTNSGKTYTVTGTPTEPGILPRSLDVIFNSIDQKQFSRITIKPKHFSSVEYLNSREQEKEEALKEEILRKARDLGSQVSSLPSAVPPGDETELMSDSDVSTMSKASSNYSKVTEEGMSFDDVQVHDDLSIELEWGENHQFSVWVSFAEIYNEFIYDLLTEAPRKGKQRPALKLAEDKNHNHFVKGLREVKVDNIDEALLLLRLGLQHRHVAATRLNYQSSRSHSIYTIKLIKVVNSERPQHAIVNRISIVDLAGAERSAKTGATGLRVKEAGNINNSLLTLGKCIDAMKYNQSRKGNEERVVPFRESKLTRLFQNYFVGKGKGVRQGKITMFVNISNAASVFDETIHVLKFSALTSKVVPLVKALPAQTPGRTPAHPLPLASELVLPQLKEEIKARRSVSWEMEEEEEEEKVEGEGTLKVTRVAPVFGASCENCKSLQDRLGQCCKEISELQVKLIEQEYMIRQEVCREFGEQLIEIEERHSQEMEEQAADLGEMYEKKYQLLHKSMKKQYSRKRRRPNDDEDDAGVEESLQSQVASLQDRVEELEEELAMETRRAAAELCDTAESHETQTVLLNQQLADMAVKITSTQKVEAQLRTECEELGTQLQMAKKQMEEDGQKIKELLMRNAELENTKVSVVSSLEEQKVRLQAECQSLREQLDSAVERGMKVAQEKEQTSALAECREMGQLRAEAEALREMVANLTSQTETLQREKAELLSHHESEVQHLGIQRADAVMEAELLQQRISELTTEKSEVEERVEELQLASGENSEKDATLSHLHCEVTRLTSQLEDHNQKLSLLEQTHAQEMRDLQEKNEEKVRGIQERHEAEVRALQEDKASFGAKLAVKQEAVYKLEAEIEAKSKELSILQQQMEVKDREHASMCSKIAELEEKNNTLNTELKEKVKRMLCEYDTMLKSQSSRLTQLDGEREELHSHNTELQARTRELELKLERATSARNGLKGRTEELSAALEDSRKALSQREAELQGSLDQCRAVLEEQVADLRKQLSTVEHNLSASREDVKSLQQQLRDKDAELLCLAKSSSGDQTHVQSLLSELEEVRQRAEQASREHKAEMDALQGHHQLETAQLNIRIRELSELLEQLEGQTASASASREQEVEALQMQWKAEVASLQKDLKQAEKKLVKLKAMEGENKSLKKTSTALQKQLDQVRKEGRHVEDQLEAKIVSLESELSCERVARQVETQALREEWKREVKVLCHQEVNVTTVGHDEPIYEEPPELPEDTTIYETIADEPTSTWDPSHTPSVLKPIENTAEKSVRHTSVASDLDRSKPYVPILETSSQLIEESFVTGGGEKRLEIVVTPLKKRAGRMRKRKRSIEVMEKAETRSSPAKKSKYPLRNRSKHQRFAGLQQLADEDVENTPLKKAPSLKKFTRILSGSVGKQPVAASDGRASPFNSSPPRTRRKKPIRKSQISGPLELMDSPTQTRPPLEVKTKFSLGRQLRPLRSIK